jgi:hypothetical protein
MARFITLIITTQLVVCGGGEKKDEMVPQSPEELCGL